MSATDPLASARNLWARHSWGDEGEGVPVAAETQNGSSHPAVTEDGQGLTRGCIVSFIDNRACEVGFAAFDPCSLRIYLTQFAEAGRSGAGTTRMLLDLYNVSEAVLLAPDPARVPVGCTGARFGSASALFTGLNLPDRVHTVPRSMFDDGKGRAYLEQVATPESWAKIARAGTTNTGNTGMYLAYGAAGALLHHLQAGGGRVLLSGSLDVQVVGTSAHMKLDAGSLMSLEILPQSMPGVPVHTCNGTATTRFGSAPGSNFRAHKAPLSLFHTLNHTRTAPGQRLLRATLLQPLTDVASLELRQDVVGELIGNEELASDIRTTLSSLPPALDKICVGLALRPEGGEEAGKRWGSIGVDPTRRISATVSTVLSLRSLLRSLPGLVEALDPAQSRLLTAMADTFHSSVLHQMLQSIDQVVDADAQPNSSPFINRIQQCFAVRGGADQLLDVARMSFCKITDQVHILAEQYREQLAATEEKSVTTTKSKYGVEGGAPKGGLRVMYSNRSGFYLMLPQPKGDAGARSMQPLPRWLLVLEKRPRGALACTTHELNALNARLRDAAKECLQMTQKVLDSLVAVITPHLSLLLRVVDCIALLDMLSGFAATARKAPDSASFTRPRLLANGNTILIHKGRHPLLEAAASPDNPPQPNDTSLDAHTSCLHIITGPNMAGKSTYLKQVGLLVVMAQCGAYVPAEHMELAPVHELLTRMGTGDSIEANASSFMVEMQEVAHFLDHAGPGSLVLVDELGRATSTADGTALAWAVCEALLAAHAPTLFATHFPALSQLAAMYPTARLWQLRVDMGGERNRMDFTWQLEASGASAGVAHYGLALAATLGFPQHLLDQATIVAREVEHAESARVTAAVDAQEGLKWSAVYDIGGKVLRLAQQVEVCLRPSSVLEEKDAEEGEGGEVVCGGVSASDTNPGANQSSASDACRQGQQQHHHHHHMDSAPTAGVSCLALTPQVPASAGGDGHLVALAEGISMGAGCSSAALLQLATPQPTTSERITHPDTGNPTAHIPCGEQPDMQRLAGACGVAVMDATGKHTGKVVRRVEVEPTQEQSLQIVCALRQLQQDFQPWLRARRAQ